jgi:hypothetical protein
MSGSRTQDGIESVYEERYVLIDSVAADAARLFFAHLPWVETHG